MVVQMSLLYPDFIPSVICPVVVLLDHTIVLALDFWGTYILFSIIVVLIYFPNNHVQELLFPYILANICCCLYLDDSYFVWSEVAS
jgi:hypothetical protein